MLVPAIILGVYGYSIFFLGLLGLLEKGPIAVDTLLFFCILLYSIQKPLSRLNYSRVRFFIKNLDILSRFLLLLIVLQVLINLIGALGPELSFDALWYHLTLPKLYLLNHKIFYIPGNLFYYSAMPQLTEMYYISALVLKGEIAAKIIHWSFGIVTCVVLFGFSKRILKKQPAAFLAVSIFYANLVVGWESIAAYSDLSRTFFELTALVTFLHWYEKKKTSWLVISALILGFAIATKLLAFGSLGIFILLIALKDKKRVGTVLKDTGVFVTITLLTVSPWLLFSFVNTGNPVFPFFSKLHLLTVKTSILNPFSFVSEVWKVFVSGDDPILPIYLIVLPLIFLVRKQLKGVVLPLFIYCLLSFVVWYLLPKIGGGRFLLPYLPAYSILVSFIIFSLKELYLKRILILIIILLAISSIFYRSMANMKYLPVVFGRESKLQFLKEHLNFSFGDFYDIDGFFGRTIKKHDKVLLYEFHNIFYVNFPFIDSSYVKKGDRYNYIAVQNGKLPDSMRNAELLYENHMTRVKLYKMPYYVIYE